MELIAVTWIAGTLFVLALLYSPRFAEKIRRLARRK